MHMFNLRELQNDAIRWVIKQAQDYVGDVPMAMSNGITQRQLLDIKKNIRPLQWKPDATLEELAELQGQHNLYRYIEKKLLRGM